MPPMASKKEIAAAAKAQPVLPFAAYLDPWKPSIFKGANRKFGHVGGGSIRRLVMAWLRGPPVAKGQRRKMTKAQARNAVNAMSEEDQKEIAKEMFEIRRTHRFSSHHV